MSLSSHTNQRERDKFVEKDSQTTIATTSYGSKGYDILIAEDSGDSDLSYVGKAAPGSAEADAVWQIMRLDKTDGLKRRWENNDDSFSHKWTEREAGTYS